MNIFDLSHLIHPEMPLFPGTPIPGLNPRRKIEDSGFRETSILLTSHVGTHVDVPAHMCPEGATLDQMDIRHFGGPAICADVFPGNGHLIELEQIKPLSAALESCDFLLLRTGWDRFWGKEEYFSDFPTLSPESARWLLNFQLKGIGVDAVSVDPMDSIDLAVHHTFLDNGGVLVENLTRLHQLPANPFLFCCFPLPLQGGDGSPARAVAITEL